MASLLLVPRQMSFIPLTMDIAFKAYFKRNENLLVALLQNFLPFPPETVIEEVTLMDTELQSYSSFAKKGESDKTFTLDLRIKIKRRVEDQWQEGEMVDVEVQTTSQQRFTDRIVSYASRLFSQQLSAGENYEDLATVYSLVFSTVNLSEFSELPGEHYHVCSIRRDSPPHLMMSQGMRFVIVELDKFEKKLEDTLDNRDSWCYILKNSSKMTKKESKSLSQRSSEMSEAVKKLWILSEDEYLQERAYSLAKERMDKQAEKAFDIAKGREEGREENREEIAIKMLQDGMDAQFINRYTQLSLEQIENLRKKLKQKER